MFKKTQKIKKMIYKPQKINNVNKPNRLMYTNVIVRNKVI